MTDLLIIDDEPLNRDHLRGALTAHRPGLTVHTFGSLRELRAHDRPCSHAVVDLSFGSLDRTLHPLDETGVDVIDHLRAATSSCSVVVMTRFDGDPLMPEMVVAIRQTWPDIRFLHKADARVVDRLVDFADGRPTSDNAAFAATLAGVRAVSIDQLRHMIHGGMYGRSGARVLLGLSSWSRRPTAAELAGTVHLAAQTVRTMLQWTGDTLRAHELLGLDEPAGIERLWPWARARRPILRRAFDDE